MGRMKDIYIRYMEEWDNHDCHNDSNDGCSCENFEHFEDYAMARFQEEYGEYVAAVQSWNTITKDPNTGKQNASTPQGTKDPDDEVTDPNIDLSRYGEKPNYNRLSTLQRENAKREAGDTCVRCTGRLEILCDEAFCGKCEIELEKSKGD